MWMFYTLAALVTAACAFFLARPLARENKKLSVYVAGLLPVCALAAYLPFGHPDMPSSFTRMDKETAREHHALLAQEPMERLEASGGIDVGALAVLGKIHMRLGNHAEAAEFYARARALAPPGDVRADFYAIQAETARGMAGN